MALFLAFGTARAGMPVFDASNFAQAVQQVTTAAEQLNQLKSQVLNGIQQLKQLEEQFKNLSGVSGVGNLATSARNILPQNLSSATSFGNSSAIQEANKIIDLAKTSIDPNSVEGQLFTKQRQQSAVNLAAIQISYQASFDRINNLQALLSQIEQSPSAKNIADLQARIQAEQLFLQNETNQLAAMGQMQQTQKTINEQQEIETRLQANQNNTNHQW